MKKTLFLIFILISLLNAQEIIIQENDLGFCSIDGSIQTSVAGYTGIGYADTDRGIGKSITWSVFANQAGTYKIWWRYANGGGTGDRPAKMLLNGAVYLDTVNFRHTDKWTNWTNSDTIDVQFEQGSNKIRIEAYSIDGLGNYDYFAVIGEGISGSGCIPSYVISVGIIDSSAGSVSYDPVKTYYDEGTQVTIRAVSNPGYFFESWTGDESSNDSVFTFTVKHNTDINARFLPSGTKANPEITGYASVQNDSGVGYLITGGSLGRTVHAASLEDLKTYLASDEPLIVTVDNKITGPGEIKVTSDKTLLGLSDSAHLQGIEVEINNARNVIIKKMKVSHVTPADAIVITGKSLNVWIDHCDLFSDRDHGVDYYDGLLDIKNESSFITVSWTKFHDHYKVCLIASGDDSIQDSVIRVTFHHNYFYNCGSRLPSIRFGKAHVFNNYFKDSETAINSRMGAEVRIERNYFENVGKAVFMDYSPEKGSVQLIDNYFGSSQYFDTPACELNVPYHYESFLHETSLVPAIVTEGVETGIDEHFTAPVEFKLAQNYPNPFNPTTTIKYAIPDVHRNSVSVKNNSRVGESFCNTTLKVYDIIGREVVTLVNQQQGPGSYQVQFDGSNFASGIYFYRLSSGGFVSVKKLALVK